MLLRQTENLPKSFISLLTRFTVDGNRIKVEKAILSTLKLIKKHTKSSPFFFFFEAVERIRFSILLRTFIRKKKKSVKKTATPKIIKSSLRYKKAIFFFTKSVQLRREHFLHDKLINELFEILLYKKGNLFLKKQEIYNYVHFYAYKSFTLV